jgi:hypothetical protein
MVKCGITKGNMEGSTSRISVWAMVSINKEYELSYIV